MLLFFRDMINDVQYISIKEILSRLLRHPLLQKLNLETVVQYTIDFIGVFGLPDMYQDKEQIVPIKNFRGVLPCDLIAINQVMDTCSGVCLRSMTDSFMPTGQQRGKKTVGYVSYGDELTFKTQNRIIFTSFEEGEVKVSYKAIPVDDDGFPLIIDNSPYLRALEAFIKQEVFTIKFDLQEINEKVLWNAQKEYAWRAGQLQSEFTIPNEAEMASILQKWTELIQTVTHRDNGYKNLGDRQYLKTH